MFNWESSTKKMNGLHENYEIKARWRIVNVLFLLDFLVRLEWMAFSFVMDVMNITCFSGVLMVSNSYSLCLFLHSNTYVVNHSWLKICKFEIRTPENVLVIEQKLKNVHFYWNFYVDSQRYLSIQDFLAEWWCYCAFERTCFLRINLAMKWWNGSALRQKSLISKIIIKIMKKGKWIELASWRWRHVPYVPVHYWSGTRQKPVIWLFALTLIKRLFPSTASAKPINALNRSPTGNCNKYSSIGTGSSAGRDKYSWMSRYTSVW